MKFVRGALRCAGLERRRDHQGHVGVRRWVSNYPSNDSRVSPDFGLALNAQTTSLGERRVVPAQVCSRSLVDPTTEVYLFNMAPLKML